MWQPSDMGGRIATDLGMSTTSITLSGVIGWLTQFTIFILIAMTLILVVQIICAVLYQMTGMEVFALFLPKRLKEENERKGTQEAHLVSIPQIIGRCVSGFAVVLLSPLIIAIVLSVILTIAKWVGA